MRIDYLEPENYKEWNEFVENSPQGSIFSKIWYLDAFDVKYNVLCVIDNNEDILAGIVLSKNQINTYSNPLLGKYLGVLLKNEDVLNHKKISKQYKVLELLARELMKYKSFDYYFHPEFKNWIPLYWKGFAQQTRYTYQISLTNSIDSIEKKFHSNLKNDIKYVIKNDVTIKKDIDFNDFYAIIEKTFLRQGSKSPYNKAKLEYFVNSLSKRKSLISFGAYSAEGLLISASCIVYDDKSSYFILNGIDIDNQIRGANALMILEAIKYSKEKGLSIFDFEGSMLPGVEQFYRRFGGELVPYMRIWNDNLFNYMKSLAKKKYKKYRYGR